MRIRAIQFVAVLGLTFALAGCQRDESPDAPARPDTPPSPKPLAKRDGRLHQPFKQATLADPPEGQRLCDQTKTGKSVGKLYLQITGDDGVGGLWDQVVFQCPQGKRLEYTATIKTDLGSIAVELWPQVAPNHVRNFIALAKAGYYDGLDFDRTIHEKIDGNEIFACIEAGCPLGEGSANHGSIGYWLKPEIGDAKHDVGTVGASRAEQLESAACKFYINLSKAPWMDGNYTVFGKVSSGLDVARQIRSRPVCDDDRERPMNPVVIRSVTIVSREVD